MEVHIHITVYEPVDPILDTETCLILAETSASVNAEPAGLCAMPWAYIASDLIKVALAKATVPDDCAKYDIGAGTAG